MACAVINPLCAEKFKNHEAALEKLNDTCEDFDHDIVVVSKDNAVMRSEINAITKSINALTKSLWGFTCSIIAALGGFFFWYVQSL